MNALELLKQKINNSGINAVETIGMNTSKIHNLDCDCVDGDCSTGTYEY